MFDFIQPQIVVIDDKKEEVENLIAKLHNLGLGCRFFNADLSSGDNYPSDIIIGVKLIFLDLFYKDDFDVELCCSWIRSVISKKSYYGLVIWSKDTHKEKELLKKLEIENVSPMFCIAKQKTDYPGNNGEKFDFEKLLNDVNTEINKIEAFKLFLIWENSVLISAKETINQYNNLFEFNEDWNKNVLSIILSLAKANSGKQLDIKDRDDIIRNAMLVLNTTHTDTLENYISNQKFGNINTDFEETMEIDENTKGKINSKILLTQSNLKDLEPGNLYKLSDDSLKFELKIYLNNDSILKDYKKQKNPTKVTDANNKLLSSFLSDYDSYLYNITNTLLLIELEVSPSCDYAQEKWKTHRLIKGFLLPKRYKKYLSTDTDYLFISPLFTFKIDDFTEESWYFVLDFRQFYSKPENDKSLISPVLRIRHDLLVDIQSKLARHINRPGFVSL